MVEIFQEIANNKKIIIIANAAPFGTGNYKARENVKENFFNVGANKVDIIDLDNSNLDIIFEYDVIYVLGGDLQYLISLNKNPRLKEIIVQFLERGIYIGESAGSVFLGKDAQYYYDIKKGTKPKYDVCLDTYKCLGLIDVFIYPHFQKADDVMKIKTKKYEKEHNIQIRRLNDGDIIM